MKSDAGEPIGTVRRAESEDREPAKRLRVALSTIGTFHSFDMARQLEKCGALTSIHTGYPRFKLNAVGIPQKKIHTIPWLHGPYMAGWIPNWLQREWEYWDRVIFDATVARWLPQCDVFCGLSGSALNTGRTAQARGARYVCDRGSTHIRYQDAILREEHSRWGLRFRGIDPRIIEREELEYQQADAILIPSQFAYRSFVSQGVAPAKLRLAPYGVDLEQFFPVEGPRKSAFDVLFAGLLSLQKGAPYLFAAFENLQTANKTLTLAGKVAPEVAVMLRRFVAKNPNVTILGHVPQRELRTLMSRSHALVLPSVQEGLALVQAQAMACGCPVVASRNTGAEDLFTDGVEGYIVAPADSYALCEAIQKLADDPARRDRMALAARKRVGSFGGWDRYGQTVVRFFGELLSTTPPSNHARITLP